MSISALDEATRLRIREERLLDEQSQGSARPMSGSPSLVAQTQTVQSYPTSAQRFYACLPQTVLGKEVEGGPGTLTPGSAIFYALNLGTAIPPVGTSIVVTFVESRWVFRFDG